MTTLPDAWLWVSGICFGMSILFNIALIVGGIAAWRKIDPVLSELRDQVRRLGDKTSHIATTAENTVELVQHKATQILGTAETASAEVTRKVSGVSAALTALFVVTRVAGAIRGLMHQQRRQIKA